MDNGRKGYDGSRAIVDFMMMVESATGSLRSMLDAGYGSSVKPMTSPIGAAVLQFIAEEYERTIAECDCGHSHSLPAGFRAHINQLVAEHPLARTVITVPADGRA